jgi:hypothetical protein
VETATRITPEPCETWLGTSDSQRTSFGNSRLPGLGNVPVHEYVGPDLDRVLEALDVEPIEQFLEIVRSP